MISFWHKEIDVRHLLPKDWQEQVIFTTQRNYFEKNLHPTSVTSREGKSVKEIRVATVKGSDIRSQLPWIKTLYMNDFAELGKKIINKKIHLAEDERYAYNLNYQYGIKMRYECHVDSNPLEGLLYCTDHPEGAGGELVIGLNKNASSIEEVNENCVRIFPKAGHLVFFDAREFPHYVSPLTNPDSFRIVVAMNYYTEECTESMRPSDLNKHLGIE